MFAHLGRFVGQVSDKPAHTAIAVTVSTVVFGALELIAHEALTRLDLPRLSIALLDATAVGCCFGLAVWVLLIGNRERRIRVRHDLERIAELNHEIRNALQVIVHSHFDADPVRQNMILESVARIDGVLKRVFPVVGGEIQVGEFTGRER